MDKVQFSIFLTTTILLFYTISPFMGVPAALISSMFLLLNALLIWMVLRILKHGVPSGRTFNDTWYDDVNLEKIKDN
jgi:hypothetical protein